MQQHNDTMKVICSLNCSYRKLDLDHQKLFCRISSIIHVGTTDSSESGGRINIPCEEALLDVYC